MKRSRGQISGKAVAQARCALACTLSNPFSTRWVAAFQLQQSMLEPKSIERADGEYADAALSASRPTGQPISTSTRSVGKGSVDNLNKLLVARRQGSHRSKDRTVWNFRFYAVTYFPASMARAATSSWSAITLTGSAFVSRRRMVM